MGPCLRGLPILASTTSSHMSYSSFQALIEVEDLIQGSYGVADNCVGLIDTDGHRFQDLGRFDQVHLMAGTLAQAYSLNAHAIVVSLTPQRDD